MTNGKTVALISATSLLLWLPAGAATPAAVDNGYCQNDFTGMVKFQFQGPGTAWSTGSNWVGGVAPTNANSADGYVCIPSGKAVVMAPGVSARVQAIDVDAGGGLDIGVAARLYANGDKSVLTSYLRPGSLVHWTGTLGGVGAIEAGGTLQWGRENSSSSALQSRPCAATRSCSLDLAPGAEGLLTVTDSGVLDLAATDTTQPRGVNLSDQYQLLVRGKLTIHGIAYIAADYGSRIELAPQAGDPSQVGQLTFDGDGDVYDGWLSTALSRGKLVNGGRITKTAGSATSLIALDYGKTGAGGATVDVGQLTLPDNAPTTTEVLPAATIATGRCSGENCQPVNDTTDPVVVSVQAPTVDTDGAVFTITETTEAGPAGSFAPPIWVQQDGLTATRTSAAVLTLRYDKTLLSAKGITAVNQIAIWRKEDTPTTATYLKIGPCNNGVIPDLQTSCVDRRSSMSKIFGTGTAIPVADRGDAQIIVRTLQFSRWVARNNKLT